MTSKKEVLRNLYEKYIRGTSEKAPVADRTVFFCRLTREVERVLDLTESTVYARTIPLKHMYDKKPAEEFDFVIDNIHKVVKHPSHIYKNKNPKRGDFCFIKKLNGEWYLCSLELIKGNQGKMMIVTAFRLRKTSYLNSFDLLWSWGDGAPPS